MSVNHPSKPSAVQLKWNKNMEALATFCRQYPGTLPQPDAGSESERTLARWCRLLQTYYERGMLEQKWIDKLRDINFPIKEKSVEAKWERNFQALIDFRKSHPNRWPGARSANPAEKKPGIWCQDLRSRFRKNKIDASWIKKLNDIHFNFEGKKDSWLVRFEALKAFIQNNGALPGAHHDLYSWCYQQYKGFKELSEDQKRLLNAIDFRGLHKRVTWEQRLEELKNHLQTFKRTPTQSSAPVLKSWLQHQKERYIAGTLTPYQARSLTAQGIQLGGHDKSEEVWNTWYEKLKAFRTQNPGRWPSRCAVDEAEKRLCNWCQVQRQLYAGTLPARKPLSPLRIEKLNRLQFHWNLKQYFQNYWDEQFQKLKSYVEEHSTIKIPPTINGTYNPSHFWLKSQLQAYRAGSLKSFQIQKLKALKLIK